MPTITEEKNLFVPLKTEFYEAFEQGLKDEEFRLYGPRWNEKTCRIGRNATLSKGYGKHSRMVREIIGFKVVDASYNPDIKKVYPEDAKIAAIRFDMDGKNGKAEEDQGDTQDT
jgi:hypothetical protein